MNNIYMDLQSRKIRVALISVATCAFLTIGKFVTGLIIGSISVMSEAVHSGVDLLAALIALFSVRVSGMPADKKHPFGHGKIENISGAIEALLIFFAAIWIIYESIRKLIDPKPIDYLGLGILVMLISALINFFVSEMLFKVAKKSESMALEANAWHLRTDVFTSAGVMISLAAIWVGNNFYHQFIFYWLDPFVAILIALLIIRTAYKLTIKLSSDLMDESLPEEEEVWIGSQILNNMPSIHGFHRLRTRKAGNHRFVEFHIKVDPSMSIEEAHSLTVKLSERIKKRFPESAITVHTEPCDANCLNGCSGNCTVENSQSKVFEK